MSKDAHEITPVKVEKIMRDPNLIFRKVKRVLHHDDSPCDKRLEKDGLCKSCGFHPDMQSTFLWTYCVYCDKPLDALIKPEGGFAKGKFACPSCHTFFELETMEFE